MNIINFYSVNTPPIVALPQVLMGLQNATQSVSPSDEYQKLEAMVAAFEAVNLAYIPWIQQAMFRAESEEIKRWGAILQGVDSDLTKLADALILGKQRQDFRPISQRLIERFKLLWNQMDEYGYVS